MTVTRIYATAITTAIVLIAAAATTMIGFPSVSTVLAQQQQQQHTIHITKDGTNSYTLSGGSSQVGSFDTTYRVVGERSAVRASEHLIISTITSDFRTSPTIGYIRAGGTGATGTDTTLPNPFASHEQITERITSELRRVITQAETNTPQGRHVEIKCDFGMSLEEMRCHHVPSAGAAGGAGALATEAPTAPTDTTGTEAPTAPTDTTGTEAPTAPTDARGTGTTCG